MSDVEKVARAMWGAIEARRHAPFGPKYKDYDDLAAQAAAKPYDWAWKEMQGLTAMAEAALAAMGEREAERLSWSEKGFAILSSLPPDVRGLVRPSQREDEVYLAASEGVDERLVISISEDGIAYCYQVDGRFCPGKEDWQDPRKIPDDVIDHLRRQAASPRPETVGEAVKAERERCARIAEADRRGELAKQCGYKPAFHTVGKVIAAAIRATEESKG